MTVTIEFAEPYLTDKRHDGTTIGFPFTVTRPGEGARLDLTSEHLIKIAVVGTRASIWDFERFDDIRLAPTLFEYAYPEVEERLLTDRLDDTTIFFAPDEGPYPFDLKKLREPTGVVYEIDIQEARLQRKLDQKSPIGFYPSEV